MKYPGIRRTSFSEVLHDTEIHDPYRFMENEDEDTQRWTTQNNELLEDYLDNSTKNYFTERLEGIVDFDRYTPLIQKGDRFFFQKHGGTKSQPSLYYRDGIDGDDHLIIDFSTLSEDGTLAPTTFGYSDDGKYISICLSQSGNDWQEMVVLETETGEEIDRLTDLRFTSPSWKSDNSAFYYTKFPSNSDDFDRTSDDGRIFLHKLMSDQDKDEEIFKPEDEQETPSAVLSNDKSYLILSTYLSSGMGNKLSFIDLNTNERKIIQDKYSGTNFQMVEIHEDYCYILTNKNAPLNKIIRLPTDNPDLENQEILVAESENLLQNVSMVGGKLFVTYLINAVSVIKIFDLNGQPEQELDLPKMGTVLATSGKITSNHFFYSHTSYPYLPTVYNYDIEKQTTVRMFDNRADFDDKDYILKQVHFPSQDGTQISMFIIHRKDLALDGTNPCLLWSYGGFNISLTPGGSLRERYKVRLMIEEGGVYACPNIRGGGEYGKEWHKAGTKERKQNVFDDFIVAAEYLIDNGYTSSQRIVSHGGSNGGLLVAVTMIQRPELWGAVIGEAGVMDMLRYHKFTFGKYWTGDYGDPDEKEAFEYLLAYSPVHNVTPAEYPAALFYCADTDTRVVPMHTKKLVAELQYQQQEEYPILIRTETKAGHNFGKPISKVIEETAIMFAFIWKIFGLKTN